MDKSTLARVVRMEWNSTMGLSTSCDALFVETKLKLLLLQTPLQSLLVVLHYPYASALLMNDVGVTLATQI